MPRQARETSTQRVYHVILRGVNKQQIFECTEDYERFLSVLSKQTRAYEEYGEEQPPHFCVYAYCLMGGSGGQVPDPLTP